MRKYSPEGSTDSYFSPPRGKSLSIKEIKQIVKTNPDNLDLNSRVVLIKLIYGERSEKSTEHIIWLIDNHPKHCALKDLAPCQQNDRYRRGRVSWLRQIRANPDDVTILYHAALFFILTKPEDSIRFLQRAANLDPSDDQLPLKLSHVYTLMAGRYSVGKNKKLVHKAVEQLKIAIECYSSPSAESSYLQHYFCMVLSDMAEVAFTFDLLDDATDLARILLNHQSIREKRLSDKPLLPDLRVYDRSLNHGHAILGRVALVSGKIDTAKEHMTGLSRL